jgi:nucleotide-binding universal stress UspA family protein
MKILIGVDDSPHARAAVECVRKMAWPAGTSVVVLSVVRPAVGAYAEVYAPGITYADRLLEDQIKFHEDLASQAERTLREAGLPTEARVVQGDPREALVDAARAEHCDLIVMGSHGRTGIAKLLIGSVASHVVSHAPCSVMVVKLGARHA